MRALLLHVWLLLSLRHSGSGLPRTLWPLFELMLAASLMAALRWEVLYEPYLFARAIELFVIALALFFWLLMLAFISPAFAGAFALVSMAADTATILFAFVGLYDDNVRIVFLLIETVALSRIVVVLFRRSRTRRRT